MKPIEKLAVIADAVQALKDLDCLSIDANIKDDIRNEILNSLAELNIVSLKQRRQRAKGELQEDVVETLQALGQGTAAQVAEIIDEHQNFVNSTIARLRKRGIIKLVHTAPNPNYGKGRGRRPATVAVYQLADNYQELLNSQADQAEI